MINEVLRLAHVTFLSALATAVSTGIGGVPFLFTRGLPDRHQPAPAAPMAVPAALAVAFFEPLVLLGLGVAPAPWGFLVFTGIIPEAAEHSGHGSGAAAVIAGFLAMMLMPNVLQEGGQGPAGSADRGRCRLE